MSNANDDLDRTIMAIGAIKLIRDCYASGAEGQKRISDVIDVLAMGSHENALRKHMAAALKAGLTSAPVKS